MNTALNWGAKDIFTLNNNNQNCRLLLKSVRPQGVSTKENTQKYLSFALDNLDPRGQTACWERRLHLLLSILYFPFHSPQWVSYWDCVCVLVTAGRPVCVGVEVEGGDEGMQGQEVSYDWKCHVTDTHRNTQIICMSCRSNRKAWCWSGKSNFAQFPHLLSVVCWDRNAITQQTQWRQEGKTTLRNRQKRVGVIRGERS